MFNTVTCDSKWADTFVEFTDKQLTSSNVPIDFDPSGLRRSRTAKSISHACVKRCLARYFELRPTERFTGTVAGKDKLGNPLVRVDQTGTRLPINVPARDGIRVSFRVRVWNLTLKGVDAVVLGGVAA